MATIRELRERVREMYRAIETPWSYPRFPDPPTEFLPPGEFLELGSEAVLTHHTKINHPFCVRLVRGGMVAEAAAGLGKAGLSRQGAGAQG